MFKPTVNRNNLQTGRDERGVSVIEVLISVLVLAVGLVAIVGVLVYVSRANTTSNSLNILAAATQDQVDRLRSAIWTKNTEDPMITVGGSVPTPYEGGGSVQALMSGGSQTPVVGKVMGVDTSEPEPYTYTLDSDNHHATISNTPVGDLRVSWQVRQGPTVDLRYVTIHVVQIGAANNLREGFRVTTIISRG